jgi:hypothetical protein
MNILVLNDLHMGSNYALSPKHIINNPFQSWVYQQYELLLHHIKRIDVLVTVGDMVDGPGKHDSTSNWTTDVQKQVDAAVELLKPFLSKETKVIGVGGSGYHIGRGTGFDGDELLVEALKGEYNKGAYYMDTPFGIIQFVHVAKNIKNEADTVRINNGEIDGKKVTWLINGHLHRYEEHAKGNVKIRHCPCWQYPSDFMAGFGVSQSVDIGCLLIKIDELGIYTRDIRFPIPEDVKRGMSGWMEITMKQIQDRNKKDLEQISKVSGISTEIIQSIQNRSILDIPSTPNSPEVKDQKKHKASKMEIPKI